MDQRTQAYNLLKRKTMKLIVHHRPEETQEQYNSRVREAEKAHAEKRPLPAWTHIEENDDQSGN